MSPNQWALSSFMTMQVNFSNKITLLMVKEEGPVYIFPNEG